MIFARVLAIVPFTIAVAASGKYQCKAGNITCCKSVQTPAEVLDLMNLFSNSVTSYANALVGVQCDVATKDGAGYHCDGLPEALCCMTDSRGGAVNFGCSPALELA
ncbi:hypothetical protein HYDPIDRAFT_105081 [Hydnomerulius pinastri MD-312]|nr:hypothetical protein HYDPIDRAFT_105081 [Hydnomerulius pinastri MD-312]